MHDYSVYTIIYSAREGGREGDIFAETNKTENPAASKQPSANKLTSHWMSPRETKHTQCPK